MATGLTPATGHLATVRSWGRGPAAFCTDCGWRRVPFEANWLPTVRAAGSRHAASSGHSVVVGVPKYYLYALVPDND